MPTAKKTDTCQAHGFCHCLECSAIISGDSDHCPRCHANLHQRKPNSIQRSWIFLITSIILFFPANLLPITYTNTIGQPEQVDTIISSILFLWHHGSYLIALIIFIASIFTPFFKIAVLLYLLTHRKPQSPPIMQTRLYRFIHFVGRWSMIDVFVVALLGALMQNNLASITPGAGIFAFAAVVVFTILATEFFDIRLLWDQYREHTCKTPS